MMEPVNNGLSNMVEDIVEIFEELNNYIMWFISLISGSDIIPLLNYLYTCIPLFVRMVFIVFLLFLLIIKLPEVIRN